MKYMKPRRDGQVRVERRRLVGGKQQEETLWHQVIINGGWIIVSRHRRRSSMRPPACVIHVNTWVKDLHCRWMFSKGFQKYQYMWSHKQLIKREEEKGYKLTKQSRIFHTLRGTLLQHSCIAFSFHGLSPIFLSHSRLFSTHPLLCVSLSPFIRLSPPSSLYISFLSIALLLQASFHQVICR